MEVRALAERRARSDVRSRVLGGLLAALFLAFAALALRPPSHVVDLDPLLAFGFEIAAVAVVSLLGSVFLSVGHRQRRRLFKVVGWGLILAASSILAHGVIAERAAGMAGAVSGAVAVATDTLAVAAMAAALVVERRLHRPALSFMAVALAAALAAPVVPGSSAAAWVVVAVGHWAHDRHGGPRVGGWLAVACLGLGLGSLARVMPLGAEEAWGITVGLMPVLAGLIGLLGLMEEVQRFGAARSVEAREALSHVRRLEELAEADRRSGEERRHDVKSALTAIEYAALAMRRHGGELDATALEQLELALQAELALLRRLVALPGPAARAGAYDVETVVSATAAVAEARGMDIEVDCGSGVMALGDPLAAHEILQNVVENAAIHAPGSPVRIRCDRLREWALIEVEDGGPGIPEPARELIFKRGRDAAHPTSAEGSGLGLFIARRLATEQRGHIWASDSSLGGASIRVALPIGPESAAAPAPVAAEPDEAGASMAR